MYWGQGDTSLLPTDSSYHQTQIAISRNLLWAEHSNSMMINLDSQLDWIENCPGD
jgi:hypothetical protein